MCVEVKMTEGEVLDKRGLSVYPGEGEDRLGGRPAQSVEKFGKLIDHFGGEHLVHPTLKTNVGPRKQRNSLARGSLLGSCTETVHWPVLSTWLMASKKEALSLFHLPGDA